MDMGMDLSLDMEPEYISPKEDFVKFERLKESNIVPKVGAFLGLDISKDSTGVCLYLNGEKHLANISIEGYNKTDPFAEAKSRMSLQKDLLEFLTEINKITVLDLIVIEDVFEGVNPATTRMLYALNTAIDELILWGKLECKEFARVSNQSWKSWLSVVDNTDDLKGLNDKLKIQMLMEELGIKDSGEGFQDRLDATGMILGYLIKKSLNGGKNPQTKKPAVRVQLSDIQYAFEEDDDLIRLMAIGDNDSITTVIIEDSKMSKKKMIDYLSSNLDVVFITSKPIMLGMLAGELGLQILPGQGGYFGFWLKPRALDRYKRKLEEC